MFILATKLKQSAFQCPNHVSIKFWMNKEKLTRAGFESACALPTERTSPILAPLTGGPKQRY